MLVNITNSQTSVQIDQSQVENLVKSCLQFQKVECDEIGIHFVDKETISELHQDYFDDPTPTDCITFPIDPPGPECEMLGEVAICTDIAVEYSQKHQTDLNEEVSLYIIHGLLHLLGFRDMDDNNRKEMQKEEKRCLKYLKSKTLPKIVCL